MSDENKKTGGRFTKKEPAVVTGAAEQLPPTQDSKPPVEDVKTSESKQPPVVEEKEETGKIKSEAAALKLFKKDGYKLPAGLEVAYVSEDANVFFNENNARAHTKQRMKLFTINP